jgi:Fe-S-cluster containining protein
MGGPDFTRAQREKVLKAGHPDHFIEIRPNQFELKSRNGVCPYLAKDCSCSIHELRPPACRAWPVHVKYDEGGREYLLIDCLLTPKFSEEDIREMKKQASRIFTDNIINSFNYSKLSKPEINLIEKRFRRFKNKQLK